MSWEEKLSPDDRKAWEDFVVNFRREAVGKISGSSAFLSVMRDGEDFDVKMAVELGTAILMDKPLLVTVLPGESANLPKHLVRAADKIIEADMDTEEGRDHFAAELRNWADSNPSTPD